ncbi:putative phosphatase regulatory subunit-domain-containing protein [Dactylonectria estremocensis]|uniref:Phosphatase regulatory subunit-domain-containing protein n=1 Tax=Dactylonectria estremocensis TaxID=1079267 RepID=A0A9P9D8V0_9HYPO|nr:putative phosphatase regulatory subunit-domain-containing protein [Dactylonectria estremocensis]
MMPYIPPANQPVSHPSPRSPGDTKAVRATEATLEKRRNLPKSHVVIPKSSIGSEQETDAELYEKPRRIRKMSGELVRPALRSSSSRRPSSMPTTPTTSKGVHFDSHLEDVRHFLNLDCPLAVSSPTSPVIDNHNYLKNPAFKACLLDGKATSANWEILAANFLQDSTSRKCQPVYIERTWLSPDEMQLQGSVMVQNIAFQKSVACRFTFDCWITVSEVSAEYSPQGSLSEVPLGYDRFTFCIQLPSTDHLESKTLSFCVRYTVNARDYWDNNYCRNFQINFRRKHLLQHPKSPFPGVVPQSHSKVPDMLLPKPMPSRGRESGLATRYDLGALLLATVQTARDGAKKKRTGLITKYDASCGQVAPLNLRSAYYDQDLERLPLISAS